MKQIICNNLDIGYDNTPIVKNINFSVEEGDYLCVVGDNGKGKSTLFKTMLRIISPIKGEVIYDENVEVTELGYLPQHTTFKKDFPASVYEVVLSGCASRTKKPFYSKVEKIIARENMKLLGIESIENESFSKLSGGQVQRTLLARALSSNAKILFLDEPITGLDFQSADSMYKTINDLNKIGITIIMITHDIHTSLKYAKHVFYMGDEMFFGTCKEFKDSNIVKEVLKKKENKNA